jgi:hypothetical protein
MTVDAARRPRRRAPSSKADLEPMIAPPASIVIGEFDQTIFECPSCSRPLALGARRCPGCGTRLIRGVTLGKASGFVAVGLAAGLLAGFGGAVVLGLSRAVAVPASVATQPSGAPVTGANGGGNGSSGSGHSPAPTATPATPTSTARAGIPSVTGSALTQVIGTNARLAADRAALKAALDASTFDPSEVAQILRSISADSIFGQQVAGRLAGWSGSSAVAGELATFYGSIHEAAANGLVSSVRNAAAYRSATTNMVNLLDGLRAIDAAVRAVAASAGLDLPTASGAPTAP